MKVKKMEKEMDKKVRNILHDLSILMNTFEAYEKEASDKRKIRFEKKMEKKYRKEIEMLDEIADVLT